MAAKHPRSRFFLDSGIYDDLSYFADLEERIACLAISKDKGDAFEVFAEAYLATQNITQGKHVWPFAALPLSIAQDLQLDTGRDMGVDGVIETPLGQYDAYQVKFRSGRPKLTWDELSTFMGLTDQVSQRILFTNCDDFPKLMNDRTGFFCIRGNDLDRLEQSDFETIRQWLASGIIKATRKQPFPHQAEALDAILPALEQQDRATAVMACGTGKTLVALWLAERMQCKSVVVLLPSLALVRQTLHEWLKETTWPELSYLCVCSDPTVSRGADSVLVRQSDLDFSVTTDTDDIRWFLAVDFSGVRIVFSTYQSAHLLGAAMQGHEPFDLGIFDEAHKTTGRQGAKFGFALSDDNLAMRKRLFLTATPRHYNINRKNKEGDAQLVYSMDAPDVYGHVAHTLSFAKAAEQGIICDYKVVISVVTSEMLGRELIQRSEVLVDGDTVNARQVANQIAISQAVEKYGVNRIFSFHASVASARSFTSDQGEGIGSHLQDFDAFHVNGAMPTSKRAHVMKAFAEANRAVISNARCLTEGVDVPAVDMVAFMSPRKSKVDIVQATGRAMRKSPGKEVGYVLIPLFLEMENEETVEEALERTGLEDIWNVLQAMQEQDDALVDVIRQMREDKGRTGGFDDTRLREKIETIGPELSLETLQNTISAACVDQLGIFWDEQFGELKAYMEKFGDCAVNKEWPDNPKLGAWVSRQRVLRNRGKLVRNRIDRLDEISFIWDIDEWRWENNYALLKEFKNKNGHCNISMGWTENPKLASWVAYQRRYRKKGVLSADHISQLDKLHFQWNPIDEQWKSMFLKLVEFQNKHGHCRVPHGKNSKTPLSIWVNTQRKAKIANRISEERLERLNEIGFVWEPFEAKWNEMFEMLVDYKHSHGHCNVPINYADKPELAQWVSHQRRAFKKHKLGQDRIDKLADIGFQFSQLDANWEEMFTLLLQFKERFGHCNVSRDWEENKQLGIWVATQRKAEQIETSLSRERRNRLDAIGFIWNTLDAKWEEMYMALVEYKNGYGNCLVPGNWPPNPQLSHWVKSQRSAKREMRLTDAKISRLESIGFVWNMRDAKWEEMVTIQQPS